MAEGSESHLQTEKGYKLFCKYWNKDKPDTEVSPKGIIFIIHGFAEHCLPYKELAEILIGHGFYVFSHDHVGHGQSEGIRAHVLDFKEYVDDMFTHIDKIMGKYSGIPVFLIGHSMGGGLAVMAANARPNFFRGVVLISPLILLDPRAISPWKVTIGRILARIIPQFHIGHVDPKGLSRDVEAVKQYENDPLVYHNGVKCRWGLAMINFVQELSANLQDVEVPFLVMHGTADTLCDLRGSQELYDKATSKDKQIKLFPDAYHQLLHELPDVKQETLDLTIDWLNKRA